MTYPNTGTGQIIGDYRHVTVETLGIYGGCTSFNPGSNGAQNTDAGMESIWTYFYDANTTDLNYQPLNDTVFECPNQSPCLFLTNLKYSGSSDSSSTESNEEACCASCTGSCKHWGFSTNNNKCRRYNTDPTTSAQANSNIDAGVGNAEERGILFWFETVYKPFFLDGPQNLSCLDVDITLH
eukprot:TRINITY_DN15183_c0_g1_i1.p1 TRINITY_DN15183_c0_g1~~TRINITY_DN15183_c0_g1_i1.p1  ORF type:complete len:182 (+),score=1.10 TRINITY_DN15183_c0_g1_i1:253-798(+)